MKTADLKRRLRREFLAARRSGAGNPEKPVLDARLRAHILDCILSRPVRRIALTWPLEGEPDLRPLFPRLAGLGRQILLPRVISSREALAFAVYEDGMEMEKGLWNTRHPRFSQQGREVREFIVPDLIFVPCLAFDRRGIRLGYGGGMYDRTLAACPSVPAIGFCGAGMSAELLPEAPHDRALGLYCTPFGVVRTENGVKET